MSTKPDANQVKSCISELSLLLNQLNSIETAAPKLESAFQQALSQAKQKPLRDALSKISVDELARDKLNVRLSALHEAGIKNLWQLYEMPEHNIIRIEGIGEQSAQRIKNTVNELAKNTESALRVRVSLSDPASHPLILALYDWVELKPLCDRSAALRKQHERRLRAAMNDVRALQNPLTRLLTFGKRKNQALESWDYLSRQQSGAFSDSSSEVILRYRTLSGQTKDQKLAAFEKNAAVYIAALDQYLPAVRQDEKTFLAKELVDEIERIQPDLRLLNATLRGYQSFGCKYILHQKRVLLGDEMGLGKTMQAIAAIAAQAAAGRTHFLVVCPASVLINWRREVEKFCAISVMTVHGPDRDAAFASWQAQGGVAVTTYETISRLTLPEGFHFDMLVVDEAHYAKNPKARRTKSVSLLCDAAENVLFMTGTPLENNVEEMCALVRLLDFGLSEDLKKLTSIAQAQKFRETLAPVYLRRVREDVLTELPDLIEKDQWCDMGKAEKLRYAKAVAGGNFADMRRVSWHVDDPAESGKALRLMELCDAARENRRKVIVFSFFLSTLDVAEKLLADRCAGRITGAVAPAERQAILDRFKEAPDGAALLCQIQAGGTGLNIQSASVVIFCEPQIKPSLETQAVARAYRMGQLRDVLSYRLLCEKTIDEKILKLLTEKQQQFDSFAEESVIAEERERLGEIA